jgi:hypothetical protein
MLIQQALYVIIEPFLKPLSNTISFYLNTKHYVTFPIAKTIKKWRFISFVFNISLIKHFEQLGRKKLLTYIKRRNFDSKVLRFLNKILCSCYTSLDFLRDVVTTNKKKRVSILSLLSIDIASNNIDYFLEHISNFYFLKRRRNKKIPYNTKSYTFLTLLVHRNNLYCFPRKLFDREVLVKTNKGRHLLKNIFINKLWYFRFIENILIGFQASCYDV